MSVVRFRYTEQDIPPSAPFPQGRRVRRPMLPAIVTVYGGGAIPCLVHVDTGADCCVFPLSFARRIGLRTERMPSTRTSGATGAGTTYYADVRVAIPIVVDGEKRFLGLDVYAGFLEGLDAQGIGLLGQAGFFDKFPVLFDQPNNVFSVHVNDVDRYILPR